MEAEAGTELHRDLSLHLMYATMAPGATHAGVEQPVDLEDGDEVFNWPWLYAVQVGEWGLTEKEAKVMREYLLRGGFFVADDFHGLSERQEFEKRIGLPAAALSSGTLTCAKSAVRSRDAASANG